MDFRNADNDRTEAIKILRASVPLPAWILFAALLLVSVPTADAGITMDLVLDSLTLPIYATAPPGDPRLFLAGQRGTIHIIENDTLRTDPFLDIDSLVHFTGIFNSEGFYGIAFHPDYATNGYFFVYYMDNAQNTVVARYSVSGDPNKADHGSAVIVHTLAQPHIAHNGGEILFGPDGMFYLPLGDGGFFGDPDDRAQDPQQFFGKILRIDVDSLPYSIPPDNPFVGNAGFLPEIWAMGTRNPYRPSFDALTGDFWIADVGEDMWEEINVEWAGDPGGHNYGWSNVEGYDCFDPPTACGIDTLDAPLYAYDHTGGDCSITGGFVYRGTLIPNLYGYYLYGDFCSRRVGALLAEPDTVLDVVDLTPQIDPGSTLQTVTSIVSDGFGEAYLIDRTNGVNTGRLYRLVSDFVGLPGEHAAGDAGEDARAMIGAPTPNPFRDTVRLRFARGGGDPTTAHVFDVRGRLIRSIDPRGSAGGIEWNGRDEAGRAVPAGIYFIRMRGGTAARTERITLVR